MTTWADLDLTWSEAEGSWGSLLGVGSRFTFQPPAVDEVPRTHSGMSAGDARFWSHFRRGPVGRNVFKLVDGTYTEQQPADDALIDTIYHGGHIHFVDEAEAARLEAAGYEITEQELTSPTGSTVGDLAGVLVGELTGTLVGDL